MELQIIGSAESQEDHGLGRERHGQIKPSIRSGLFANKRRRQHLCWHDNHRSAQVCLARIVRSVSGAVPAYHQRSGKAVLRNNYSAHKVGKFLS